MGKRREGSSSVVEGLTSAQPSPAQRSAAEPREAPRLQSARWPGLGASSSGSLCESANPREEKRPFGAWLTSEEAQSKVSKPIPLTVVCFACAPQTKKVGRGRSTASSGERHVFFLFSTRSLGKQKDNQTMRLFRCAAADLRCIYGFFGPGRNQDDDQDQHTREQIFSAPRMHVDSRPAVSYQFPTRDWRGAMLSSLASKVCSGRAWSSGETRPGCQGGYPRFLGRTMAPWESGTQGRYKY